MIGSEEGWGMFDEKRGENDFLPQWDMSTARVGAFGRPVTMAKFWNTNPKKIGEA